jgi:hypothetical protein
MTGHNKRIADEIQFGAQAANHARSNRQPLSYCKIMRENPQSVPASKHLVITESHIEFN